MVPLAGGVAFAKGFPEHLRYDLPPIVVKSLPKLPLVLDTNFGRFAFGLEDRTTARVSFAVNLYVGYDSENAYGSQGEQNQQYQLICHCTPPFTTARLPLSFDDCDAENCMGIRASRTLDEARAVADLPDPLSITAMLCHSPRRRQWWV